MPPERIQLFHTCLVDSFFPNTLQAVIATLEATGVAVEVPAGQTCCGQPAYNAGYWEEAREIAKYSVKTLEGSPLPIVVPSGSCAHMLLHGFPKLFKDNPAWLSRVEALALRTHEWSTFIVDILGFDTFKTWYRGKIAYHPSCHLTRGLKVDQAPRRLLGKSFGQDQVEYLSPDCCGFGGVFAVEHPDLSSTMLDRKVAHILSGDTEIVTGCDVSCLVQIEGRLRRLGSRVRCVHLAELLVDRDPMRRA